MRNDERTVFGVCLTRRENVVIHDTTASTLTAYLPAWFRQTEGAPGAFLLMPLHENKRARRAQFLVGVGDEDDVASEWSSRPLERDHRH